MKKTSTLILGFLLSINLTLSAQFVAEYVNFNNYVSPTDNDLENHFYGSGFGMSLTAIPTNGITGGCLLTNDTNIWGNDNATYCSKFKGDIGLSSSVVICFKYDTSSIDPAHFERPVSIWFYPSADFNHYLITTISRQRKFEQITYGWVNPTSPTLPLQHDHWYKFSVTATYTGGISGDQIDVVSYANDLGTSGTDPEILIGTASGSFNDSILFADSAISVSINGAHWGGAIYLDNFSFEGFKSPDSCLTVTGINQTPVNNSGLTFTIENNVLHLTGQTDYKNTEFEILNLAGQKMQAFRLTSSSGEIDLSQFLNGIYFLYVKTPGKSYTSKFILAR